MSLDSPAKQHRIERHLMRQRGAGARTVNADFGFTFAGFEAPLEPTEPNLRIVTPATARVQEEPATKKRRVNAQATESSDAHEVQSNAAQKSKATSRTKRRFVVAEDDVDVRENEKDEESFVVQSRVKKRSGREKAIDSKPDQVAGLQHGTKGDKKRLNTHDVEHENAASETAENDGTKSVGSNGSVKPTKKGRGRSKKPVGKTSKARATGNHIVEVSAVKENHELAELPQDEVPQVSKGAITKGKRKARTTAKKNTTTTEDQEQEPVRSEIEKDTFSKTQVPEPTKTVRKKKAALVPPQEEEVPTDAGTVQRSRKRKAASPPEDQEIESAELVPVEDNEQREAEMPLPKQHDLEQVAVSNATSRKRKTAPSLTDEDNFANERQASKKPWKNARQESTVEKTKLEFTPPHLQRRPLQETDVNRSPSPKKSPQKESKGVGREIAVDKRRTVTKTQVRKLGVTDQGERPLKSRKAGTKKDLDVSQGAAKAISKDTLAVDIPSEPDEARERIDPGVVINALPKEPLPKQRKKAAKVLAPDKKTMDIHAQPVPIGKHLNSSQGKTEEEDIDWLFAPTMPKIKSVSSAKAAAPMGATATNKGAQRTKMADMDLDDLLASVATFAADGRPTAQQSSSATGAQRARIGKKSKKRA